MSRLRIVNLGLPKSGTTTLATALKKSGFKVADHRVRRKQTDREDLHKKFVGDLIYRGYFEHMDPLRFLGEFDAFTEISVLNSNHNLWPQTDFGLLTAMRLRHPGVKFVATRRVTEDLSASMAKWNNIGKRLERFNIPGLPSGYGKTEDERMLWIEAHYAALDRLFEGDADFLSLRVHEPDAPEKLGAFLGTKIKWWGVANKNPATEEAE